MSDPYHWNADLLELLVSTIPKLNKSKSGVVDFFRGAGVPASLCEVQNKKLKHDKSAVGKYEIAREILLQINDLGDQGLMARREIIRRVVDFEDFTLCWDNDQAEARGLVAQVREIVERRDSFTRMNNEREREVRTRREINEKEVRRKVEKNKRLDDLKESFSKLFAMDEEPILRGKEFENLLNNLFSAHEVSVRESFEIRKDGVCTEQIDGVVEIDGVMYLVEAKWCWHSISQSTRVSSSQ